MHSMKNKYIFVPVLLLVLAVSSYIISVMGNSIDRTGDQEELLVVTSFYPVHIAAMNVIDDVDGVRLECLSQQTSGCVHDVQLTTEDMRLLEKADLFIVNGAGMESYLESVTERYPNLRVVDTSVGADILESEGGHNHGSDEDLHVHAVTHDHEAEVDHDHEAEVDHDHEAEVDHDHEAEVDHDHEAEDSADHEDCTLNAHIWMDMNNYCVQIGNIRKAMAELDAEHADRYTQHAEAYESKVRDLMKRAAALTGEKSVHVVSTHEAFSYFAENLGWYVVSTVNMDENTSLQASQVSEIIDTVQKNRIPYVITETTYGTDITKVLTKETESEAVVLNTLTTGKMEMDAYLDGMSDNLTRIEGVISGE